MEVGTSGAEPIWTEFLRKLTRRGLRGVKLVTPVPTAKKKACKHQPGCNFRINAGSTKARRIEIRYFLA